MVGVEGRRGERGRSGGGRVGGGAVGWRWKQEHGGAWRRGPGAAGEGPAGADGVAAGGTTALNSALASCAQGVAVMNIDNGFGAACAAIRMLSLLGPKL